ncbi:MAG: hypothetical protein QXP39_01720 [Candidatus Aenigmatarchaeota archaeon]
MQEEKKRWKEKDWYTILAYEPFKDKEIGEIPATDPKQIIGRVVEIGVDELTGKDSDAHMKIKFKIEQLDNGKVFARPIAFYTLREHLARVVRKDTQKIEAVNDIKSKNGLIMHIKTQVVMNKVVYTTIGKAVRKRIGQILEDTISKSDFKKFLLDVISGNIQKRIKKECSKIYPVRFAEIAKIETKLK